MTQKEKVSQKISRQLLEMIEFGQFPPGSKLPTEMELTNLFGVSRMPIREALSVLRAMGIISSQQGGRSYVEEVIPSSLKDHFHIQHADKENIRDLFEMRKILEPEAAYLAACRRTTDELDRIREVLKRMEHDSVTDGKTGREADFEFHRAVIEATHNSVMIHMLENLSSLYHKVLDITLKQNIGLKIKKEIVFREHQNIFLAIEAEEPELAKVQSIIHLKNVEKKFDLFLNV
ncbi:MAG TPA: FadR/GntR family transcriptional regulator [Bacillota bacterium]|nr:FadR/GntR family transcriptional regulator [Bacillota bacterium]